jgi:hypothetical protein
MWKVCGRYEFGAGLREGHATFGDRPGDVLGQSEKVVDNDRFGWSLVAVVQARGRSGGRWT